MLVGNQINEVTIMNTLTVNVHDVHLGMVCLLLCTRKMGGGRDRREREREGGGEGGRGRDL